VTSRQSPKRQAALLFSTRRVTAFNRHANGVRVFTGWSELEASPNSRSPLG